MLGRLGVVGLGSMGGAIASRLLDQAASIAIWNRTTARAEPFRARGAEVLASPAEVARCASIVLTCVTDEHALGQVLLAAVMSTGEADLDFSALVLLFERLAGLRADGGHELPA
jgi:3-hydroxyisobutyrate dehydrogenase-like beta-hydroxyacid dehydrogenase